MRSVRSPATLLLVVTLAASGCSLGVSGPDPDRPRNELPDCNTGKGSVMLDGVMATLLGLGAIAAFGDDEQGTGGVLLATSALFTASAYRGNRVANECRAALDEFALRSTQLPQVAERPAPLPRPAVRKKPVVRPPQPEAARLPPDADPAVDDNELAQTPEVPPPYQAPRPAPEKPAKKTVPKPRPPAGEDDWSSFWEERP